MKEQKARGVIRHIGLSTHNPKVGDLAAQSGEIEMLLFSINPAFDLLPASEDINTYFAPDYEEQIKRRIDAEQEHLDLPALGRQNSHLGVVRAQTDMADHTFGLLLLYIDKKRSVHNPVKFRLLIHKVDHAQVEVICPQARQQILKGRLDLLHVPCADVLPVLPGGAEVPLDDPPLPLPGDGRADI